VPANRRRYLPNRDGRGLEPTPARSQSRREIAWLKPSVGLAIEGPRRRQYRRDPLSARIDRRGRKVGRGAGAGLDRVEREDEAIVEEVQRGVRSRLYDRGRYSPARETGVHHFHQMLAAALSD